MPILIRRSDLSSLVADTTDLKPKNYAALSSSQLQAKCQAALSRGSTGWASFQQIDDQIIELQAARKSAPVADKQWVDLAVKHLKTIRYVTYLDASGNQVLDVPATPLMKLTAALESCRLSLAELPNKQKGTAKQNQNVQAAAEALFELSVKASASPDLAANFLQCSPKELDAFIVSYEATKAKFRAIKEGGGFSRTFGVSKTEIGCEDALTEISYFVRLAKDRSEWNKLTPHEQLMRMVVSFHATDGDKTVGVAQLLLHLIKMKANSVTWFRAILFLAQHAPKCLLSHLELIRIKDPADLLQLGALFYDPAARKAWQTHFKIDPMTLEKAREQRVKNLKEHVSFFNGLGGNCMGYTGALLGQTLPLDTAKAFRQAQFNQMSYRLNALTNPAVNCRKFPPFILKRLKLKEEGFALQDVPLNQLHKQLSALKNKTGTFNLGLLGLGRAHSIYLSFKPLCFSDMNDRDLISQKSHLRTFQTEDEMLEALVEHLTFAYSARPYERFTLLQYFKADGV